MTKGGFGISGIEEFLLLFFLSVDAALPQSYSISSIILNAEFSPIIQQS